MIVDVDGLSVGVFNIDGEFYALNNLCPHQLAPLCEGEVSGFVAANGTDPDSFSWEKDGYIIRCPWHNWEFDITSGGSVFNPHKVKARTYDVDVEAADNAQSDEDDDVDSKSEDRSGNSNGEGCPCSDVNKYGTSLRGEEPPVETYDVNVEDEYVVLYM